MLPVVGNRIFRLSSVFPDKYLMQKIINIEITKRKLSDKVIGSSHSVMSSIKNHFVIDNIE